MQPPTDGPRAHLTAEQVVALIRDSPASIIGKGCELLDMNLNVVEDISDDFAGGSVSRASYATLHGTATLGISRDLDWGRALVRPYMTMSDGVTTARFNLGAYFTSTPQRQLAESPPTHEVRGFDILHALASPVGDSYAVAAGVGYLAEAERIVRDQGYTAYFIDQQSAGVLPEARAWMFDDQTTWLHIVNDLLAGIGYQGVWSDWDGRLRMQSYQRPQDRAPEWHYDTGERTSMIDPQRTIERDYFESPNRWVFYRTAVTDGPPPVEGDGIFTYVNAHDGPTSVEARGRVITAQPRGLDVADQSALEAAARSIIDADLRLRTTISVSTFPNPLHWHFDRLSYDDAAAGPPMQCLSTKWTLPLSGDNQAHDWSVL